MPNKPETNAELKALLQSRQGSKTITPLGPLPQQTQQSPNMFESAANTINNAYDTYKNAPVIKQARQLVGGVVGIGGGLIGGAVGATGESLKQSFTGKTDFGKIFQSALDTAKSTAQFGFDIGSEGAAAAPLGAAGKAVNLALAYGQGYQGVKDISQGLQSKDAAQSFQGALELGTALVGTHGALENRGTLINKNVTGAVKERVGINQSEAQLNKAADVYRQVLNLGKSELKKEQRSMLGGRERDVPRLLAQEGILLQAGEDNKLNTDNARQIVQQRSDIANNALDQALASDKGKWFDLNSFLKDAHDRIDKIPNVLATEKEAMKSYMASIVQAEKQAVGNKLTGEQANQFKRGLYKVGYPNGMNPANVADVRASAELVKTAIEKRYTDQKIRDINKIIGDYAEMDKVLENAHGRVVRGGLLMRGLKQLGGMAVGGAIGSPFGPLGAGVGASIGNAAVGKGVDFMLSPSRLTGKVQKKLGNAGVKSKFSTLTDLTNPQK